jgi:hypothetical protein
MNEVLEEIKNFRYHIHYFMLVIEIYLKYFALNFVKKSVIDHSLSAFKR